ncbi:nuclear pore complex protein Nup50 [Anticarsia gemmatalis]|uniref:nuclear pore complex protein Nup50 n=1 Tax=Anticarsia gemmatalis TaxID=129554 RepID=UPI003F76C84D
MSIKRPASTDLNHENWDQDDPVEEDSSGPFKTATQDILEKRVIRTVKRRSQIGNEPKKSVFGGFGAAYKTQPASFDFLSKLTNGSNDNSTSKADSSVTSSLFTSKPSATSPGTGLFSLQTSTASPAKSPFGSPSTLTGSSSLFGVSSTNTTTSSNMFMTSKPDSTVGDSPFKIQTVTSSTDNKTDSTKSTTTLASSNKFAIVTSNPSPFKTQPVTNTVQSNFGMITKSNTTEAEKSDDTSESKMKYYSKLKGLNESVCNWIKKHVEQTPLCILTPIFNDYEKYLKEIQDELQGSSTDESNKTNDKTTLSVPKTDSGTIPATTTNTSTVGSSLFNTSPSSKSLFAPQNSSTATPEKPTFSFGINANASTIGTTASSPPKGFTFGTTTSSSQPSLTASSPPAQGFTFGTATTTSQSSTTTTSPFSLAATSSSPFSLATNTSTTTNGSAGTFSFGMRKPFSFSSNIQQNTEKSEDTTNKEDDEDAPPKVEYTPVVEENSVFDKKCKIFVKKDGNFVDKGVGTLYIKKVEESGKHQLLVRANTNLGTVLVNLILVSAIPTQRMGKNNVMMVCIPTPDSKPPPTPILIRVKTSEEADELLATLDKYKT